MNAAPRSQSTNHQSGYYLSVILGLILSGWVAGVFTTALNTIGLVQAADVWRVNIAGGVFLGFIAANPVGAAMAKSSSMRVLVQFILGFAVGVVVQKYLFVPLAGEGMSNYLFLLVAVLAIPLSKGTAFFSKGLKGLGFAPAKWLEALVLGALRLPDRLLFVLVMGISSYLFWYFSIAAGGIVMIIVVVMIALMTHVSKREADCDYDDHPDDVSHRKWLEIEPEDTVETPLEYCRRRLKAIALMLVPGAVLFGAMIRLAAEFLQLVYPDLHIDFDQPVAAAQTAGIAAASGLAVVLFGMMAVLGTCLLILRLIGVLNHWSAGRFKENYLLLIRLMYFRPTGSETT